jgi:hypothetical protein
MYTGQLVFSQVTDHPPMHTFRRCVKRYQGERYVKRFRCFDQHLSMAFAQLTYRESLRDIEACLRAHQSKLYHMGIRSRVARSTLFDANEHYTILQILSLTLFEKDLWNKCLQPVIAKPKHQH